MNNNISDRGAIKLAEVLPSSKVTSLDLIGNNISDTGAIKLAEALPRSKVTRLYLSRNNISDTGAIKLAEMLPSSKVEYLSLSNNTISDTGAIKLAEMLPSSKLTELYLSGNAISDSGATKLAEALPSSKVTKLDLVETVMSVKRAPAIHVMSEFKMELVPNPSMKFSDETKLQQNKVIDALTRVSRGLFLPNPAVSVDGAIKSGQFYNSGLGVNKMVDAMKNHNLVLRVSVSGEHNACAIATHEDLTSNAIISSPSGSFSLGISGNTIRSVDLI